MSFVLHGVGLSIGRSRSVRIRNAPVIAVLMLIACATVAVWRWRAHASEARPSTTPLCQRATSVDQVLEGPQGCHLILGHLPRDTKRLAIGIPTVWRDEGQQYLEQTLASLLDVQDTELLEGLVIVILAADTDPAQRERLSMRIGAQFSKHVRAGTIVMIDVPQSFYPPLYHKRNDYGDSEERTLWRQKQCVDFSFLMAFSSTLATIYLQLEDDVVAAKHYLPAVLAFADAFPQAVVLEFTPLGFIGKAFPARDLPRLAQFFHTFYADQPVDLLLQYYTAIQHRQDDIHARQPPLFQHLGLQSSLRGKQQPSMVSNFEAPYDMKRWTADTIPAVVTSTMVQAFSYLPVDAYLRAPGGFWASQVRRGDVLTVALKRPARLRRVQVRTGTKESNSVDQLQAGTLSVHFEGRSQPTALASFETGAAEVTISDQRRVRRVIVTSEQDHSTWVMIQEIALTLDNRGSESIPRGRAEEGFNSQ